MSDAIRFEPVGHCPAFCRRHSHSGARWPRFGSRAQRRLIIQARPDAGKVELELLAVFDEENLEDRLACLSEETEGTEDGEISLRLLRHHASSVHHQKYHGLDIVTVRVRGSA